MEMGYLGEDNVPDRVSDRDGRDIETDTNMSKQKIVVVIYSF